MKSFFLFFKKTPFKNIKKKKKKENFLFLKKKLLKKKKKKRVRKSIYFNTGDLI